MILKKRNNDINIFKQICKLVIGKEHTNLEGLSKITELTSKFSSKLTNNEKLLLPQTIKFLNSDWVTGFVDAEGNFFFSIIEPKEGKNNYSVNFSFNIGQENSEIKLLYDFVTFFNCGQVFENKNGSSSFYVSSKVDLNEKLIPFFEKNKLQSIKQQSFLRFKKALGICLENKPLSNENIIQLNKLIEEGKNSRKKK